MNNNSQCWQTRTPLRVRVLGLLFVFVVLVSLGLLWLHWEQNIWLYSGIACSVFALAVYGISQSRPPQKLFFDESSSEFSLLNGTNKKTTIHIVRVWQSAFAITLQVQTTPHNEIKQLTFWRSTLSSSCWRKLHIHLWRYQLQYQLADSKGAR